VAGAIPETIMKTLEGSFGKVATGKNETKKEELTLETYGTSSEPRIERQYKKLEQIQVGIAYPTFGRDHKDSAALGMLSYILGGSMSSRLFLEVRERHGLCYFVRAEADGFKDIGSFTIRAGLDAARLPEALKVIFAEVEKIKSKGVSAEELAFAKDHIAGATKLAFEDSFAQAEFVGRQEIMLGDVKTIEEKLKKIRAVTKEDVKRVAKLILTPERMSLAVVGPYKTDAALREALPVIK
jgi:predicted Zn-dependent peptidase